MNVSFIVTNSDSDISHFAEVKVKIILMIVRSDPAYPHTPWFLTCEDPHRVIILENKDGWERLKLHKDFPPQLINVKNTAAYDHNQANYTLK